MPPEKSTRRSTRTTTARKKKSSPVKFLPNLTQINDAAKELPDPDTWKTKSCTHTLEVDGKHRTLEFVLKSIQRGSERTPRWVYEGKILIRKRDV